MGTMMAQLQRLRMLRTSLLGSAHAFGSARGLSVEMPKSIMMMCTEVTELMMDMYQGDDASTLADPIEES